LGEPKTVRSSQLHLAQALERRRAMMKPTVALSLVLSFSAASAFADDLAPVPQVPDDPSIAITMSPVHLAIPLVELTAEVRVARKFGIAVIGGAGVYRDKDTNTKINLYEGGVSARYYVTGSFRTGLQLGAEAVYLKADADATTNITVRAVGLGLSPFVGYKWTHGSGFTFDSQLGVAYMAARAKADTGQMADASKIGPMLNLNVGYSF
jgi:hypothetical protein